MSSVSEADLDVWQASLEVWRAGARTRRMVRFISLGLLLAGVVVLYLWSVAPFGGPSSGARYAYLGLQWAFSALFAFGITLAVMTLLAAYPARIEITPSGLKIQQTSARTGRVLPYSPTLSWQLLASSYSFHKAFDEGTGGLGRNPIRIERSHLTWGGISGTDLDRIAKSARIAGYSLTEDRRHHELVYRFLRDRR